MRRLCVELATCSLIHIPAPSSCRCRPLISSYPSLPFVLFLILFAGPRRARRVPRARIPLFDFSGLEQRLGVQFLQAHSVFPSLCAVRLDDLIYRPLNFRDGLYLRLGLPSAMGYSRATGGHQWRTQCWRWRSRVGIYGWRKRSIAI
jgi:hypothetical protein